MVCHPSARSRSSRRRRAPVEHAHWLRWKVEGQSWGRANIVTFSQRIWGPSTSEADTDRKGDGNSWETSNTCCNHKRYPALPSPISQNGAKQFVSGALLSILQSQFPCFALMRVSFASKGVLMRTQFTIWIHYSTSAIFSQGC
jgi:hypothetical protein